MKKERNKRKKLIKDLRIKLNNFKDTESKKIKELQILKDKISVIESQLNTL